MSEQDIDSSTLHAKMESFVLRDGTNLGTENLERGGIDLVFDISC
jgi:uncharacterized protein YheU (UPF0270 family)